ncbi:hypothetical protein ACRAWF_33795 [Streptomyces sp. L7]
MRCLDVVMAFPGIALAAVLVAVFGGGILPCLICASSWLPVRSPAGGKCGRTGQRDSTSTARTTSPPSG